MIATRRIAIAALTVGLAVLAAAWGLSAQRPPRPRDAAPPAAFSTGRAHPHLEALASAPRPVGSAHHAASRAYLIAVLDGLGAAVEVQHAIVDGTTIHNVVARVRGTGSAPALALVAHYDTVPGSPGAGDDAAGVAAILEATRALRAGAPLARDLIVLLSDGEELGLLGARAFVARHRWAADVGLVLNVEARGTGGPVILFETTVEDRRLIEAFARVDTPRIATSLAGEVYRRMPNDTDLTVFRERGVPGMNLAFIGGVRGYHAERDDLEALDLASVQHHGELLVGLVRELDGETITGDDPTQIYFGVGPWLVRYDATIAVLLWLALGAALAAALAGARRAGRLSLRASLAGAAGAVATVLVPAVAVELGWRALTSVSAAAAASPEPAARDAYLVAQLAVAVAVAGACRAALGRRLGDAAADAGAASVAWALCGAATFVVAGASYLPGLVALVAVLALAGATAGPRSVRVIGAAAAAAAALLIAVCAPLVTLISTALTLDAGAVVGALVGLAAAPVLGVLRRWAPDAAHASLIAAAGVALIAIVEVVR